MIETVEIRNYQPHKHTVLEFSKGVNVIKGTSHHGKSSIWRLMKWILLNRPLGEGFRSHFAGKDENTEGHMEFDNGVVSRIKGKSKNQYEVSGHPDPLEALRSDLPKEVTEVTNMSEINLSGQDDSYFLILDSPGKVARALNNVVGLDIIDQSLTKCNSIISKSKSHKEILKKDLAVAKDKHNKLDWVNNAQVLINKLQDKLSIKDGIEEKYHNLCRLRSSIQETQKEINWAKDWLKIREPAQQLQSKIVKYRNLKEEIIYLTVHFREAKELDQSITDLKLWLEIKTGYDKLKEKVARYTLIKEKLWRLKSLYTAIDTLEIDVNSLNKHVSILNEQYNKTLKSAGVCPLCKRPW
jgi:exonuclease SbcC